MRVTLKQIAELANVSINTVSIALRNMSGISDATRKQIHEIAAELGYFEQNKPTVALRNLCLISPGARLQDSYFFMTFYQTILRKAQEHGYTMMVLDSESLRTETDGLLQMFKKNAICGLILLGDMEQTVVQRIVACQLPVVLVGTRYQMSNVCTIIEDNFLAMSQAIACLTDSGYRKIGFIGNPFHSTAFGERYQSFMHIMRQKALPVLEEHLFIHMDKDVTDDYAYIRRAFQDCAALPEAFVCANDHLGILLMKVLHTAGISVPQDIALVGIDNSGLGKMSIPTMTSVDVHCAQQAECSVRKLISFVHGAEYEPLRFLVPTTLVQGASTATPAVAAPLHK